ncbi:MAG: hypothetical protein ACP5RE_03120 [Candidatus Acidifodinimicrobium sp.]
MVKYDGKYLVLEKEVEGSKLLEYIREVAEKEDIYIRELKLLGPYEGYVRVHFYSPIVEIFNGLSLDRRVFSTLINTAQSCSQMKVKKSIFFGHTKRAKELIEKFGEKLEDTLMDKDMDDD